MSHRAQESCVAMERHRLDDNTKRMMRYLALSIVVFAAAAASPARAQVLGPALDGGALEIGCTYKWYERDFESDFLGKEDWSSGAFYLRYGACRWATISFEGGIWTVHHEDFEDIDYRRYAFGGGLTALCLRRSAWQIEASAHYSEIFDHDRSGNQLHKNVRDVTAAIHVERSFTVRRQPVVVWAGPAFVYDQSRQYPWQTDVPLKNDTSHNVGFIIGLNAVFFGRLSVFSHGVYADTFQPRLGAGIRF